MVVPWCAGRRTNAATDWSSRQLRNPPFSFSFLPTNLTVCIYMNSTPITADVAHHSFSQGPVSILFSFVYTQLSAAGDTALVRTTALICVSRTTTTLNALPL